MNSNSKKVREWYVKQVSEIAARIDKTLSLEEQAKYAFNLRNNLKIQARIAMTDKETAQELNERRPVPNFEELLKDKMMRKALSRQEAIEDILKTATTTNEDVNKEFGL